MEKEKLETIKKSQIIKGEKLMGDFEWYFLDIRQVQKRIEWLIEQIPFNMLNIIFEKDKKSVSLKTLIDEAFEEIVLKSPSKDCLKDNKLLNKQNEVKRNSSQP